MTTTAKTERRQKPRRPTIDEMTAGLVTGEEYRHALLWARGFRYALLAVLVLLVVQAAQVARVVVVQVVRQTSLVRPLTAEQRQWLRATGGRGVTMQSTANMTPPGWVAALPAAVQRCARVPTCAPYVNQYARFILRTSPEVQRLTRSLQQTGGAALLIAAFGGGAMTEARTWPLWERRQLAALTRRKARTRRP